MNSAAAVSFDANGTIGAYQIGVLISYMLLGVTTTQTYIYYSRFPEDPAILKALVAFVWVCEVTHAICVAHALYQFTILDFGHPERLFSRLPVSLDTAIFFSALIEQSVLGFFSFRIYTLSKKLYVPILIMFITSIRLLGSMVTFVVTLRLPSLQSYTAHWGWLSIAQWSSGVANDVLTTVALVVLLYNQRTGLTWHVTSTVALVDKIIVWTIETGMLTSATAIFMIIFASALPRACHIQLFDAVAFQYLMMKERMIWLGAFVVSSRNKLTPCPSLSLSVLKLPSREFELQRGATLGERHTGLTAVFCFQAWGVYPIEILQTTTTNAVVDITAKFPSQPQPFQASRHCEEC
ncbi:hypothetical protein MVEN_02168400 [Mycena venus]|uniref:DUF6534 domain-containing protein n=1 Tax=Mycena venus TaxID=2733690 RepID=A0A8H7CH67_9AGAR|nr:hypothetical protein MVEN_02168400 [Mycena venus]